MEAALDGLHSIGEYTGGLASIPAAVERLRAAGVLDLVKPTAATAPATKPKDETVEPDGRAAVQARSDGVLSRSQARVE